MWNVSNGIILILWKSVHTAVVLHVAGKINKKQNNNNKRQKTLGGFYGSVSRFD